MVDDLAAQAATGGSGGDPRLELVYEEAVRSASLMRDVNACLRAGAGTLLSATAIATSFLAGLTLGPGRLSVWAWVALAAFVGSAAFSVLALRQRDLPLTFDTRILLDHYVDATRPRTIDDMRKELARFLGERTRESERRMRAQFVEFYAAAALLVVELLAWVAALALRE